MPADPKIRPGAYSEAALHGGYDVLQPPPFGDNIDFDGLKRHSEIDSHRLQR